MLFYVTGISSKALKMELSDDGRYYAEFETPDDFKPNRNRLRIYFKGHCEISNVVITEH